VATLGVDDVHVLGQVSNEELTALYDVADLFLCASEHEGFCVPLMEAFHKRVPVMALAAAAVPETMDGGGVLYDTTDPARVAALMASTLHQAATSDAILESQDAALARLVGRDFAGLVRNFVDQAFALPRAGAPVAPDFWDQFRQAEALETLHE